MCGVVGLWRHDGAPADAGELLPMLATIVHRGPDDSGTWQGGRVALGFQRLTILDLTLAAHQPMATADELGVLVYNGEIYNYRELRAALEREGAAFASTGDAEVVLQALHCWGPERAIPRFNGMFALAYVDRRADTLWLARDRIGIKPLAVCDTGSELLFASEAKALLAHPRMRKRPDALAISKWVLARHHRAHRSLFEGVDGLAPATWWRISAQGIEKRRYHDPFTDIDIDRLVAAGSAEPEALAARFREAFAASVQMHLASDVPLATTCSGGFDSSLVTAYARKFAPKLHAYVADVQFADSEGARAARVCEHLGVAIRRVRVDRERYLRLWPHTVWHLDRPAVQPSDPAMLAVTQTCRADGVKVLLTGEGSDELFGGYAWHRDNYRRWKRLEAWFWRLLPARLHRRAAEQVAAAPFHGFSARREPEMFRRLAALDPERELTPHWLMQHLARVEPASDRAFLVHCIADLYFHMSSILLRHDRIGLAASIEMRVPFLENGLIDLAFHLPRRAKLHAGQRKWVVMRAAQQELPRDVIYARKKGFPMPPDFTRGTEALLTGGLLAGEMGWSARATDAIAASTRSDWFLRYELVGLEMWLRIFFSGERPEALGEKLVALAR
jgi:asparagine synthase (glutamine-hydrolysing)